MAKHIPTPPFTMNGKALEHYKAIIRQLDGLNTFKVHKSANLARLLAKRDKGTADEIEQSIILGEARKLNVTVD